MKINKISDEIIIRLIMPNILKYLYLSTGKRKNESYSPASLDEFQNHGKYNDIIFFFASRFKENFTSSESEAMFYRLKTLTISEEVYKKASLFYMSLGYYRSDINKIVIEYYRDRRISQKSVKETLIHELLHMASTRKIKEGIVTGLEIPCYLGSNLNEGYTDYLTEKYFTRGPGYVNTSNSKLFFAKGIENIVGKELMQRFYFDANLNGLIEELSKYSTKEDIIKLLYTMDRQGKGIRTTKEKIDITNEIAKINARKLENDLSLGIISYEEYQIEYAIKVTEYLKGNLWSEETRIIKDNNCFILSDQEFTSIVYELKQKEKNKENYYH